MGSVYSMDILEKGPTHILGGTEKDGVRFHNATQIGVQFKTYKFFISRTFHVMFLDHGWLQVANRDATDKGGLLYKLLIAIYMYKHYITIISSHFNQQCLKHLRCIQISRLIFQSPWNILNKFSTDCFAEL